MYVLFLSYCVYVCIVSEVVCVCMYVLFLRYCVYVCIVNP